MDLVSETIAWLTAPADWVGPGGIPARLWEHVAISGISLAIAIALALPIALWVGHTDRGSSVAVAVANLGRAVPTLAAIAIAVPLLQAVSPELGLKVYPTVLAMVLLAVPPILVNGFTAVRDVDRDLVEAARGMGLRELQVLTRVEVPVALPAIVAGVRSATVQVIATATLGAIFGFGGLGRFLVDGIAQQDDGQIWGGVVLVAALVIAAEAALALLERRLASPGLRIAQSAVERDIRPLMAPGGGSLGPPV